MTLTIEEALPVRTLRRNLRRAWAGAEVTDALPDGLAWYANAHDEAQGLADEYDSHALRAAGVIAALSPQVGWARNLGLADELFRTGTAGHYANAVDKARKIADGANPLSVLSGRKTRSFYRNISRPHEGGPVTLDRHALRIASPTAPERILERAGAYEHVADQYRHVAAEVDLLPHELQAVLWVDLRRQNGTERRYG